MQCWKYNIISVMMNPHELWYLRKTVNKHWMYHGRMICMHMYFLWFQLHEMHYHWNWKVKYELIDNMLMSKYFIVMLVLDSDLLSFRIEIFHSL